MLEGRRAPLGLGRCLISMVRSSGIDQNLLDNLSNLLVSMLLQYLYLVATSFLFIECSIFVIMEPITPSIQMDVKEL